MTVGSGVVFSMFVCANGLYKRYSILLFMCCIQCLQFIVETVLLMICEAVLLKICVGLSYSY